MTQENRRQLQVASCPYPVAAGAEGSAEKTPIRPALGVWPERRQQIRKRLERSAPLVGGLLPQGHQLMLEAKDDVLGFPHFPSGISGLEVVVVL